MKTVIEIGGKGETATRVKVLSFFNEDDAQDYCDKTNAEYQWRKYWITAKVVEVGEGYDIDGNLII